MYLQIVSYLKLHQNLNVYIAQIFIHMFIRTSWLKKVVRFAYENWANNIVY